MKWICIQRACRSSPLRLLTPTFYSRILFYILILLREALMAALPENFAELKQRLRATWMAGDFGQIARLNAQAPKTSSPDSI